MAGGSEDSFIQPLGFLLGLTAILALALSYLGQSTIIAFISVGVIVNAIGVEADPTTLGHFAEVGILILLFMAGLEVDLAAFARNWKSAAIVGVGQIACCTGLFAALGLAVLPAIGMDATSNAVVYFGLCGCFSSTILVLGYLKETRSMGTLHGQLCLGTLVLQDAASVLGIAVLGGLEKQDGEGGSGGIAVAVLVLFAKLLAAMAIILFLERFVLERLFGAFARSLELLYLGSLGYATGMAALAVTAGFSGEITAFLAGVSLSRLPYKMHIETKMEPLKSLGVAIFFISLGLGLELGQEMLDALPIGFGLALFKLCVTLPLFAVLGLLAGLKSHTVFMLGLLMNQISEFSLILCTLCVRAGVFDKVVLTVFTVAAVVSIIVSSIGHAYIDRIYQKVQRWSCLRCIDDRRRQKLAKKLKRTSTASTAMAADDTTGDTFEENNALETSVDFVRAPSLLRDRPSGLETDEAWAFEDQLKLRTTEHLEIDLEETQRELERVRESMAVTANEKRRRLQRDEAQANNKSSRWLYGRKESNGDGAKSPKTSILSLSHATDIMHGMIEGYVVVDHQLLFCTLRAGRMLFYVDQHDVGHAPLSAWDVSGMSIIDSPASDDPGLDLDNSNGGGDDEVRPWEWTIVLGHIHRHTGTSSIEEDSMKLAIHGLEDHSDHDAQDWHDALAVATSMLNPIALRLAHIREELHSRRDYAGKMGTLSSHDHRNEIICIGYNEMFPAVLSLADAIDKEVVVVEYDPMKLNTIEKLYSEERRRMDRFKDSRKRTSKNSLASREEACTTDDEERRMERFKDSRKRTSRGSLASLQEAGTTDKASTNDVTDEERQRMDSFAASRKRSSRGSLASLQEACTTDEASTDDISSAGNVERSPIRPRPTRLRTMSTPMLQQGGSERHGFWALNSRSEDSGAGVNPTAKPDTNSGSKGGTKGVKGEYADIHDPECWEELEMDHAFMLVCTMKGARHAEKAMLKWLQRRESKTIFVVCTQNNAEATEMYQAGAHFVMQTDALAMRSTREIFLETVTNFGDCSQLVAAGKAHKRRLLKLEEEDSLKFQYETG